jgi:hypothetical protein
MVLERMIELAMQAFKEKLSDFCQDVPEARLSMESAQVTTQGIQQALACAGQTAFRIYLESKEVEEDSQVLKRSTCSVLTAPESCMRFLSSQNA